MIQAQRRSLIPLEEQPKAAEFYAWSFPGAPVQVHLYSDVVLGIGEQLQQAATAGNPAPIQGILLGRIATPGLLAIMAFRQLSTPKPAEVEAAIASLKGSGNHLQPLGYFRTNSEDHLALSPEDISLAETYFSDPNCVFLLIQPSATDAPNAGFFYWDRGKMNGGFYDFCFLEFPFDFSLLSVTRQENAPTNPPADPPPVVSSEVMEESALPALAVAVPLAEANAAPKEPPTSPSQSIPAVEPAQKPRRRPWPALRLTALAVLLTLNGLAAGIFFAQKFPWVISSFMENSESSLIALRAERRGDDLTINWNHNSPLINRADNGRLIIYDGGAREFPLDRNYIRFGSVVYSPSTNRVRVELQLQVDGHRTSESVMVILGQPQVKAPPAVIQPAEPPIQAPPAPR